MLGMMLGRLRDLALLRRKGRMAWRGMGVVRVRK
jgi:hypothetical protein